MLKEFRPDLLPEFEQTVKEAHFTPGGAQRGASIAGKFEGEISETSYAEILSLLQTMRQKLGFSTMIGSRNINLIVNAWANADRQPRLPP